MKQITGKHTEKKCTHTAPLPPPQPPLLLVIVLLVAGCTASLELVVTRACEGGRKRELEVEMTLPSQIKDLGGLFTVPLNHIHTVQPFTQKKLQDTLTLLA